MKRFNSGVSLIDVRHYIDPSVTAVRPDKKKLDLYFGNYLESDGLRFCGKI